MSRPKIVGDVEIRRVGADVLVHDQVHDQVHVLNATAGFVLERCDGTRSTSEIAMALSLASGVEFAHVNLDVEAVLSEFAAVKLVAIE
jgi:hypothetical protein